MSYDVVEIAKVSRTVSNGWQHSKSPSTKHSTTKKMMSNKWPAYPKRLRKRRGDRRMMRRQSIGLGICVYARNEYPDFHFWCELPGKPSQSLPLASVVVDTMPGPYYCQHYGGVVCGFGKGGNPAAIKGRCKFDPRCNEMRCASCCFCARHGLRERRNAGRGAASIAKPKAKAKAHAASGPPAEAAARALAPVARLPNLAANVMAPHAWHTGMLESVNDVSETIIGTY